MIHDDNARQTKCMLLVLIISKIWHIMKRGDTGYFRTSCSTSNPTGWRFRRHRAKKSTQRRGFFLPRRHATPQYGYLLPPRIHQRSAQFSLTQPQ